MVNKTLLLIVITILMLSKAFAYQVGDVDEIWIADDKKEKEISEKLSTWQAYGDISIQGYIEGSDTRNALYYDVASAQDKDFELHLVCSDFVEDIAFHFQNHQSNSRDTHHIYRNPTHIITDIENIDTIKMTYGVERKSQNKYLAEIEFIDIHDSNNNYKCGGLSEEYFDQNKFDEPIVIDIEHRNIIGVVGRKESNDTKLTYTMKQPELLTGFIILENDDAGVTHISLKGTDFFGTINRYNGLYFSSNLPATAIEYQLNMQCGDIVNGIGFQFSTKDINGNMKHSADYHGGKGGIEKKLLASQLDGLDQIKISTTNDWFKWKVVSKLEFLKNGKVVSSCGTNKYAKNVITSTLDIDPNFEALVGIRAFVTGSSHERYINSISFVIAGLTGYTKLVDGQLKFEDDEQLDQQLVGNSSSALANFIHNHHPSNHPYRSRRSVGSFFGSLWHKATGFVKAKIQTIDDGIHHLFNGEIGKALDDGIHFTNGIPVVNSWAHDAKAAYDLVEGKPIEAAKEFTHTLGPLGDIGAQAIDMYQNLEKSKEVKELFQDLLSGDGKRFLEDLFNDAIQYENYALMDYARDNDLFVGDAIDQNGKFLNNIKQYQIIGEKESFINIMKRLILLNDGAMFNKNLASLFAATRNAYPVFMDYYGELIKPSKDFDILDIVRDPKGTDIKFAIKLLSYVFQSDHSNNTLKKLSESTINRLSLYDGASSSPATAYWIDEQYMSGHDSMFIGGDDTGLILLSKKLKNNPQQLLIAYSEEFGHMLDWLRVRSSNFSCEKTVISSDICIHGINDSMGDEGARFAYAMIKPNSAEFDSYPIYEANDFHPNENGLFYETRPSLSHWGDELAKGTNLSASARLGTKVKSAALKGFLATDYSIRASVSAPRTNPSGKSYLPVKLSIRDSFSVEVPIGDYFAKYMKNDLREWLKDSKSLNYSAEAIRNHGVRIRFFYNEVTGKFEIDTNNKETFEYIEEFQLRPGRLEFDITKMIAGRSISNAKQRLGNSYDKNIKTTAQKITNYVQGKSLVGWQLGAQFIWKADNLDHLWAAFGINTGFEIAGGAVGGIIAAFVGDEPDIPTAVEFGSWIGEGLALGVDAASGAKWDDLRLYTGLILNLPAEGKLKYPFEIKAQTPKLKKISAIEPYFKLQPRFVYSPWVEIYGVDGKVAENKDYEAIDAE